SCLHGRVRFLTETRLVNAPTHSRQFFLQFCAKALSRWRIRLLDQKRKITTLVIQDGFAQFSKELLKLLARACLSLMNETFRAGRVVKIENRCLNERVRATAAGRMQRVAIEFYRSAINRCGNQRNATAAPRHRSRVIQEFSRDRPFHIFRERDEMQFGTTTTR